MVVLKENWFFKDIILNGRKIMVASREDGSEIRTDWRNLIARDTPAVRAQSPPLAAKKVEGASGATAQTPPDLAPQSSKPAAAGAASAPTGTAPTRTSIKQRVFTVGQQKPTDKPGATGGPNGSGRQQKKTPICQECGQPPSMGNHGGVRPGPSWPFRQHRQPPTKIEPCWHHQRNGWCPWGDSCWFGHGEVTHVKKSKAWKRRRARKLQKARALNAASSSSSQVSAPQPADPGSVSGNPRPTAPQNADGLGVSPARPTTKRPCPSSS